MPKIGVILEQRRRNPSCFHPHDSRFGKVCAAAFTRLAGSSIYHSHYPLGHGDVVAFRSAAQFGQVNFNDRKNSSCYQYQSTRYRRWRSQLCH